MYYNYIHPLLYSPLDMSLNRLPSPLPHRSCSCTDSSEHYVRPAHVKPRLLALTTLPGRLFQTLTTLPGRLFQTLTTLPGRLFQTLTTLPGRLFQTLTTLPGRLFQTLTTLPGRLFQTLTIRMSRRTYISFSSAYSCARFKRGRCNSTPVSVKSCMWATATKEPSTTWATTD